MIKVFVSAKDYYKAVYGKSIDISPKYKMAIPLEEYLELERK